MLRKVISLETKRQYHRYNPMLHLVHYRRIRHHCHQNNYYQTLFPSFRSNRWLSAFHTSYKDKGNPHCSYRLWSAGSNWGMGFAEIKKLVVGYDKRRETPLQGFYWPEKIYIIFVCSLTPCGNATFAAELSGGWSVITIIGSVHMPNRAYHP